MAPLYLLCGLLCDEAVWADVPARLADIAAVSTVSFGGLTSLGAMAEQMLATAPARFAVAGHSMGGRIALEIWRRAPHRVVAMGLLNTGIHAAHSSEYDQRAALVRLARSHGMAALAAQWLPPLMGASTARIAAVMPVLEAMVQRFTPNAFAAQIHALLHRPDVKPLLPTIHVPTLLLNGTNDTWMSVAQHSDMQRAMPDATWVEIPGAGHMAPIERPDAVARALRNWWQRASRQA